MPDENVQPDAGNETPVETPTETPPITENPEVQALLQREREAAKQEILEKVQPHLDVIATDEYKRLAAARAAGKSVKIVDPTEQPQGQAGNFDNYFDTLRTEAVEGGLDPAAAKVIFAGVKKAVGDSLSLVDRDRAAIREEIRAEARRLAREMGSVKDYAEIQEMVENDEPIYNQDGVRVGAQAMRDLIPQMKAVLRENPALTKSQAMEIAAFRSQAPDYAKRLEEARKKAESLGGIPVPGSGMGRTVEMPSGFAEDGRVRSLKERFNLMGLDEEKIANELLPGM